MERNWGVDVNLLGTKVCSAALFCLRRLSLARDVRAPAVCQLKAWEENGAGVKVGDTGRKCAGTQYVCPK